MQFVSFQMCDSTSAPPQAPLPLGKCVGGTTVVNSGTCFRTPDDVLRTWTSEHGVETLAARKP